MQNTKQKKGMSNREIVLYSMGSILLVGGTFFVGRKLVRDAVKKHEENNSVEDGSIASYAKSIKMAFDNDGWWGADEQALRTTLISIPSKQTFNDVAKSYQRLYNKSLMTDMQSELSISEYNEMVSIINGKAENKNSKVVNYSKQYETWARRLKSAFDKSYGFIPGTDEEAIKAVFIEIPTQSAFAQVGTAYQLLYNTNLITVLKSELEFWEYEPMMKIITSKPK
ncbi:MAG: hypothetical protein IPI46_09880 [Bacteroidetes bacterium]|nr:hypothetical protein [Bacteroidota bacterium]